MLHEKNMNNRLFGDLAVTALGVLNLDVLYVPQSSKPVCPICPDSRSAGQRHHHVFCLTPALAPASRRLIDPEHREERLSDLLYQQKDHSHNLFLGCRY